MTGVSNKDYFSSPQVLKGFVYPNDIKTQQARTDYTNAFTTAKGCAPKTTFAAGSEQMAHLVLTPGV